MNTHIISGVSRTVQVLPTESYNLTGVYCKVWINNVRVIPLDKWIDPKLLIPIEIDNLLQIGSWNPSYEAVNNMPKEVLTDLLEKCVEEYGFFERAESGGYDRTSKGYAAMSLP